jgi:hypothetical protein
MSLHFGRFVGEHASYFIHTPERGMPEEFMATATELVPASGQSSGDTVDLVLARGIIPERRSTETPPITQISFLEPEQLVHRTPENQVNPFEYRNEITPLATMRIAEVKNPGGNHTGVSLFIKYQRRGEHPIELSFRPQSDERHGQTLEKFSQSDGVSQCPKEDQTRILDGLNLLLGVPRAQEGIGNLDTSNPKKLCPIKLNDDIQ